jgi:hypothetical protein
VVAHRHGATQRPLLSFRPESSARAVPDLAAAPPEIAPDGLSVTVRIKQGIRFSPPVNRAVTSRDVKYAIERGFFSSVNTPYAPLYFADIVGARPGVAPGTEIPGIETPDDQTIVFRLARPRAGTLVAAMVMVMTAPVPPEYARPLDNRRTSAYGRRHVATGPYMIRNDAAGSLTGYRPNRRIELVRNPNWAPETDFRPAHLDGADIRIGRQDTAAATREILRGRRLLSGDYFPPVSELRPELRRNPTQFVFPSSGGVAYVSMNTRLAPFDDVNVRRAVVAGFDRVGALRLIGGSRAGTLATHYLPPGTTGFAEAGGRAGPGLDFYARPSGSRGSPPATCAAPATSAAATRPARDPDGRHDRHARAAGVPLRGPAAAAARASVSGSGCSGRTAPTRSAGTPGGGCTSARSAAGSVTSPTPRASSIPCSAARTSRARGTTTCPSSTSRRSTRPSRRRRASPTRRPARGPGASSTAGSRRSRRPSPSSGRGPRSRARRTWPGWCPRSATGT